MGKNLIDVLARHLKRALKKHSAIYSFLVSAILWRNRVLFELRTWPAAFGRSRMDGFWNRNRLRKHLAGKISIQETLKSEVEAAARRDDDFFNKLCSESGRNIPISFSWPGTVFESEVHASERPRVFSQVFPGSAYSFSNYAAYTQQYRESQIAVSFKKAGWDCFRHLEILNAGALLYMPDADQVPELAMAHYPKNLLRLAKSTVERGLPVDQMLLKEIRERFVHRLTSESMASFIVARLQVGNKRIVFLDLDLDARPDYLSVMTYVGFKRVLGRDGCVAPLGAGSVFDDWSGDDSNLHGLGFGYTRILPAQMRTPIELAGSTLTSVFEGLRPSDFVIVANISVRPELAKLVNNNLPDSIDRAYIWGGDRPPGRSERRWIGKLRGHLLFRETY